MQASVGETASVGARLPPNNPATPPCTFIAAMELPQKKKGEMRTSAAPSADVKCSVPNAVPRSASACRSAVSDCTLGMTRQRPKPVTAQ